MARVLITGGAGFIGYHLARDLVSRGYTVTLIDNLFRGRQDAELLGLLNNQSVSLVPLDLTIQGALASLTESYDQVYHLAAVNGTRYFYEMPHEVLRVNLLTTINLLDWLSQGRGEKVLFASSSETYSGSQRLLDIPIPTPENVPLAIDDIFNPRFSYAASKIAGELLFIHYARKYGFKMSIVRYHNVYGPRMGFEHVIPQLTERILRREDPLALHGSRNSRSFCYVTDAVEASARVMENATTDGKVLNVGNDKEEITILELAKRLVEISNFHPQVVELPAPPGSTDRRCPDISAIRALTGYEPKVSLDAGLKETFAWYSNLAHTAGLAR